ncbi:MAG: cytosolic Fe-S cluster assembly factor cfd1 [Alyxoria varia]|nr:MAG: cytosolic Fe-S cluster assembly factor cfd1 [Alyxoria varia]
MPLSSVSQIVPVLSGKGGVGKSSVTAQLALTFALHGYNVGVLDLDLTGPSIPRVFGVENAIVRQAPGGWLPVEVNPQRKDSKNTNGQNHTDRHTQGALHCMSLGFILRDRGDAVVWRGPKKTAMIKQLLSDVLWPPKTEYLFIDTPPGTSDEHISLIEHIRDTTTLLDPASRRLGAVIVTTPQAIATADVRKELSFCQTSQLKVLGVIENMAGFVCPCCGKGTNVFSKGGGEAMAGEWGVNFLGSVPLDAEGWGLLIEQGKRPSYRKAPTRANGQDIRIASDTEERGQDDAALKEKDTGSLLDKYTSCSLFKNFGRMRELITQFDATLLQET